jgi:hypothetical protein
LPSVREIVAIDRSDDNVGQPELEGRFRHMLRLGYIERAGHSGLTLQNAQARVQVSPMIMKVACFLSQHSPIFRHPPLRTP